MDKDRIKGTAEQVKGSIKEAVGKAVPMHRVGFPEDMAGLALFLASPASAYLTGQQISIDGGWSLGVAD